MRKVVIWAALVASIMAVGMSKADVVRNEIVPGGGQQNHKRTVVKGATLTVNYWLFRQMEQQDGNDGCNASVANPVTVSFSPVNAAVTVTPSSLTFTSCGSESQNGQPVAFSSNTPGEYQILPSVAGGTGSTTANAWILKIVESLAPNTAPTLTLSDLGPIEGNTLGGAFVSFANSAADAEDGDLTSLIWCSKTDGLSGDVFPVGSTVVSCSVTDSAGATTTGNFTVTVKDTTPPVVTPPANVTTKPTNAFGATVSYGAASALDIVDGAVSATCVPGSPSQFGFGANTVPCSATDSHANTGSASFTVTVLGFDFVGFFSPVDNTKRNDVKGGSTVPVKWQLWGQNGQITDTAAVTSISYVPVSCASGLNETSAQPQTSPTGATVLRYDPVGQQFVYNWQTPKTTGLCYDLTVTFTDSTSKSVKIRTK